MQGSDKNNKKQKLDIRHTNWVNGIMPSISLCIFRDVVELASKMVQKVVVDRQKWAMSLQWLTNKIVKQQQPNNNQTHFLLCFLSMNIVMTLMLLLVICVWGTTVPSGCEQQIVEDCVVVVKFD